MKTLMFRDLSYADIEQIMSVHRDTRLACLTFLAQPHPYTREQDLEFFERVIFSKSKLRGAFDGDQLVGYLAHSPGWIEHLYVRPDHHGRGIGTTLLNYAKEQHDVLRLWVFQKNTPARSFYERHGFSCEGLHDGSNNEEGEPDAVYVWQRAVPVQFN